MGDDQHEHKCKWKYNWTVIQEKKFLRREAIKKSATYQATRPYNTRQEKSY